MAYGRTRNFQLAAVVTASLCMLKVTPTEFCHAVWNDKN